MPPSFRGASRENRKNFPGIQDALIEINNILDEGRKVMADFGGYDPSHAWADLRFWYFQYMQRETQLFSLQSPLCYCLFYPAMTRLQQKLHGH